MCLFLYMDIELRLTTCEQTECAVHDQEDACNQQQSIDHVADGDHNADGNADQRKDGSDKRLLPRNASISENRPLIAIMTPSTKRNRRGLFHLGEAVGALKNQPNSLADPFIKYVQFVNNFFRVLIFL